MDTPALSMTAKAAINYIRKGFRIVTVPQGQKGPTIPGWPLLDITEKLVSEYFPDDCNIGLMNGPKSNNRADVDLDCEEVLALADLFLPDTGMIHGRKGKPRSHHWYQLIGDLPKKTIQFQDVPDKTRKSVMLVEIRWDGSQTLVPPSIHPSGEKLQWDSTGRPAEVDATDLRQRVAVLASAALVARHWPDGARQDCALALSGALLRRGWSPDTMEFFLDAVCHAASDEEADKRCQAVEDTATKLVAGEQVTGLPRLEELVGKEVVARLSKWLELKSEREDAPSASRLGGRPLVQTNNRQLRDIVEDTIEAIVNNNTPSEVFLQGGCLVQIGKDKEGHIYIKEHDSYSLRNLANKCADFVSVTGSQDGPPKVRHTKPPMDVMTSILAATDLAARLPALDGVVMSPILSAGGVLETDQGYLRSAQLYYQPPEGQLDLMLSEPTREAVDQALGEIFGYLLHGFPFVDDASRAHTLAAILLPFVRPYIQGPTPLHLINASTPATGKSLLAEVIGTISAPGNIIPTPAPSSEDEWRKKITAALRRGPPFFWIDNLEGKVQSESLCVASTGTHWSDRQLGSSTELRLPIRWTWLATANNARLHKDVVSRSILIYLDAGMEHPEERRDFKVKNPVAEVRQNRARWLNAVFVLIRYWLSQGAPAATGKGVSRFPAWSSTMGGLLECLGVPGFLANVAELAQGADPEHEAWRAFVEAWGNKYGTKHVKANDELYDLAFGAVDYDGKPITDGILLDYLEADNRPKRTVRLGIALKSRRGRIYGDWKLMSQPDKTTTHYLEPAAQITRPAAGVAGVLPPDTQASEPPFREALDYEAKRQMLLDEWETLPKVPQPPQATSGDPSMEMIPPDWTDELVKD